MCIPVREPVAENRILRDVALTPNAYRERIMKEYILFILRLSAVILSLIVPGMIYASIMDKYVTGGIFTLIAFTMIFVANIYILHKASQNLHGDTKRID